MAEYKGAKNTQGQSRAKITSRTGNGNDYTCSAEDQVVLADTNDSTLTVTLPDTDNVVDGHKVEVVDIGGNVATNNLTITQNSSNSPNINGASSDVTVSTNRERVIFVWNENDSEWHKTQSSA